MRERMELTESSLSLCLRDKEKICSFTAFTLSVALVSASLQSAFSDATESRAAFASFSSVLSFWPSDSYSLRSEMIAESLSDSEDRMASNREILLLVSAMRFIASIMACLRFSSKASFSVILSSISRSLASAAENSLFSSA